MYGLFADKFNQFIQVLMEVAPPTKVPASWDFFYYTTYIIIVDMYSVYLT